MMRILIAFVILLASVLIGIQLSNDPGYVLITINHWIIETTAGIVLFTLLLLFILGHMFLQLCHKIARLPHTLSEWNAHRLAHNAQAITRKGLIEYSEGYWQKARRHLIQALPNTDTPLLNYLTAARAAQKLGDSQLRDHYLREAQQSMPEAKIAVELTQAQLQLANNQWEQALATLRHLQDLAPHHPYVLKLLMNLYKEVRDWPQLISLLPHLKKHEVVSEQAFLQLQQDSYAEYMHDLARQQQYEALTNLYDSLPKYLATNSVILEQYAHLLFKNHERTKVELLIRRALRKEFNPQLVKLYGFLHCDEQQLAFAESLLKKNPHSAELFLCLGQLSMAQHLWGKAKEYLQQSLELKPTPCAYAELGLLYEKLNEPLLACASYKKGLELTTKL